MTTELLASCALFVTPLVLGFALERWKRSGLTERATGTVVQVDHDIRGHDQGLYNVYDLHVCFPAGDGQDVTFVSGAHDKIIQVGRTVPVLYSPVDPSKAALDLPVRPVGLYAQGVGTLLVLTGVVVSITLVVGALWYGLGEVRHLLAR